ncbi:10278_t:CDS:2, partial [Dentiscutata erythropus]
MKTLEMEDKDFGYYYEMMENDEYYNNNDNSGIAESLTKTLSSPVADNSSIQTTTPLPTLLKNKEKANKPENKRKYKHKIPSFTHEYFDKINDKGEEIDEHGITSQDNINNSKK